MSRRMVTKPANPSPSSPSARRGFTLIEVLLAMAIVISLIVLVWGSMAVSFRSTSYMTQTFDQTQSLRLAMDRMTRELSAAYITSHANKKENLPSFEETLEDELQSGGTGEEIVERTLSRRETDQAPRDFYLETAFVGKPSEVHFTSMAHVRTRPNERNSEQTEISYFVRTSKRRTDDGRLKRELVRRADTTLDDDVEGGGIIYTLIDDVKDVEFEYWRPGREGDEEDGGRWVTDWDSRKSEHRGTLPPRVRITVEVPMPGDGKGTRKFTTQAKIVMTEILDY